MYFQLVKIYFPRFRCVNGQCMPPPAIMHQAFNQIGQNSTRRVGQNAALPNQNPNNQING